jgi:hypothetical protein
MSLIAIVALTGIAGALLGVSLSSKKEAGASVARTQALYAAESGVSAVLDQLTAHQAPFLGTQDAPTILGDGSYWGTVVDSGSGTWTVTSIGRCGTVERAVQAVISAPAGGIYDNAIFAGNSSNDATYEMKFNGTGTAADRVNGDMYSGNSIRFAGDARIDGIPRAFRNWFGPLSAILPDASGHPRTPQLGGTQPLPDITGMNYPATANVNVASAFAAATYASSAQGGSAYQLPKSNLAHIFRKNPSDRQTNWAATPKQDYFLEDPYQSMHTDAAQNGSDCNIVQLNNPSIPGYGTVSGNQLVYYIDGNLWVHNNSAYSFKLKYGAASGLQVTFVVKGNLYISDNLFYNDPTHDGVAFITMKDNTVPDSGNIYFGDPSFGTLNRMDAFMYAERNFIDNNLDSAGSLQIVVNGNMTAGNQVAITRDFGTHHTKMTVNHDNRISSRVLSLPGLPTSSSVTSAPYAISMMREIAVP